MDSQEIWPNFFLVGAQKSGTTSLHEYLSQIPNIFMSKLKEPYYFMTRWDDSSIYKGMRVRSKEEYLRLFRKAKGYSAIGESSPLYLWDPGTPTKISEIVPEAKIIMILRNPIDRAFSHYLYMIRFGLEQSSDFYEALITDYNNPQKVVGLSHLYIDFGLYAEQVKRYLDVFGKQNVLVLIFEEFINEPRTSLENVLRFLETDSTIPANIKLSAYNLHSFSTPGKLFRRVVKYNSRSHTLYRMTQAMPSSLKYFVIDRFMLKRADKPRISDEAFSFMGSIYHDDVIKLSKILNRTLPWSFQ
jgi:hypothetical protein